MFNFNDLYLIIKKNELKIILFEYLLHFINATYLYILLYYN